MPADTMEKQTASPIAGAPANGSHIPDKPKNASEHRKVSMVLILLLTHKLRVYMSGIQLRSYVYMLPT